MILQDSGRSIVLSAAACAGLLVTACRSSDAPSAVHSAADSPPTEGARASSGSAHEPPVPEAPPPWEGASSVLSNGGTYRVYYRTSTATPPRGDLFSMDVWVIDAKQPMERAVHDASLKVDAAMPEHEHGMNRIPIETATGDGHFRIEGLLFHMSGLWQMYFDVTRASVTERAQVDVVLE